MDCSGRLFRIKRMDLLDVLSSIPSHVKFVNALMAVTKEEYDDACQILGTGGGVVKGAGGNKMNEIKPHTNWAKKVYNRARAFSVIENEGAFVKLFAVNE